MFVLEGGVGEGGVLPLPMTMGPDTWGMRGGGTGGTGLSKGPASFNKASVIPHLKRPPFPPSPSSLPLLAKCWEKHIAAKTMQRDKC